MKNLKSIVKILSLSLLTVVILTACNKQIQTAATLDIKLKYNFEQGMEYKYLNTSETDMLMSFGGQDINQGVNSLLAYTITGAGKDGSNLSIKVKIDSLESSANSMAGQMSSNPEEVRGKEFLMTLSELGKESDLEEAELIEYMEIGDQPSNMKAAFTIMFSDLPDAVAKIGYTWTQSDTVELNAGGQNTQMIIHSNNIIEAKEVVDGYSCFKISSTNTGERSSAGNTPQGYITTSGKLTGTSVWYFAIEEGIVIKEDSFQKFDGEIGIPTGESIPMFMDIKMINKLVK
ncbi:MAG: hypothetical protein QNK33_10085 [Bacteroidales bacterium]|nr:hypothetical protein [Bacteroidales bacterium]